MTYLIKNGRLIDPAGGLDEISDILITEGKIANVGKDLNGREAEVIEAKGRIVAPGLVDMHAHLREPGREDKETVQSGTRAAVKGGYTNIACMPNTEPPLDSAKTIKLLKGIIKKSAVSNAFIIGAITEARLGKKLTDFKMMQKEGITALSDDGSSIADEGIMLEALKAAKETGILLIEHCEDTKLSAGGVINKGYIATKMGLCGIPKEAEYLRVKRDLDLAKKVSGRIHIAHISCKESVDLVRKAKKNKALVSAETCPHYFTMTDECSVTYDTNTKMNPPLRTKEDVEAIKAGLKDGTIDVIATDHAPHTDAEKDVEFDSAPFGIIGLETALSLSVMELVEKNVLSWKELILKMSTAPANILNIGKGALKKGCAADIVIIDPDKEYVYTKDSIESRSKNSPFIGWTLKAKATHVFVSGKMVMCGGILKA